VQQAKGYAVVTIAHAALMEPVPLLVYWLMFLCRAFMKSKALSSPISCVRLGLLYSSVIQEPGVERGYFRLLRCRDLTTMPGAWLSSPLRKALARLLVALGLTLWLGVAAAQSTWLAGPEGSALSLDEALQRAQDGDTVELLPGEYKGGLVLENRRLTLRGAPGQAPLIKGDGKPAASKALWIVRGGQVTLRNLEFRGARGADGSGAGVRQEGGDLVLDHCTFYDNEHGLLATNDDKATLTIEASAFGLAPKVVGGLHHLLNVGRIARLSITGSRFQQGFEGHLIKTRARENLIAYNFIHDGQRGGASYEIDIANGGLATILGNVIGQGADSQNRVMLAYATEDRAWDRNKLVVAHNTFVNYGWVPAWTLRVLREHLPPDTPVLGINNLIVGGGVFGWGALGEFAGNRHATRGMLRDAETYAFELPPGSLWRDSGVDPRNMAGQDLSPKAEFEWPVGTKALSPGRTTWAPGAYQR